MPGGFSPTSAEADTAPAGASAAAAPAPASAPAPGAAGAAGSGASAPQGQDPLAAADDAGVAPTVQCASDQSLAVPLVSCTITLSPPALEPASVNVLVREGGEQTALPKTSATGESLWTISADGATVMLLGSACTAAMSGQYEALSLGFMCALP